MCSVQSPLAAGSTATVASVSPAVVAAGSWSGAVVACGAEVLHPAAINITTINNAKRTRLLIFPPVISMFYCCNKTD
jgi:hypothetical protein